MKISGNVAVIPGKDGHVVLSVREVFETTTAELTRKQARKLAHFLIKYSDLAA